MTAGGALSAALAFDRAAILGGEWWRAFTGQWLHGSGEHLAWNALALVLGVAALVRLRGVGRTAAVLVLGHAAAAATVLLVLPGWSLYQGASGVTAALVGAALAAGLCDGPGRLRAAALLVLAMFALELVLEARTGAPVLANVAGATDWKVHALPALAGALAGWPRRPVVHRLYTDDRRRAGSARSTPAFPHR